jgi:hypothetical protein
MTPGSAVASVVAARIVNNHVYVPVRIAGHELWFLVDTGAATTLLGMRAVGELSIPSSHGVEARGAGPKAVPGALLSERCPVVIGSDPGLTHHAFAAIALDTLEPYEGRRIDGILGADFLAQYVTEIQYERSAVRFHDPAGFSDRGRGTILPLAIRRGHPHVQGTITVDDAEIPTDFVLDVGSSLGLSLTHRYVERHGLADRLGTNLFAVAGRGIGGASTVQVGRNATVHLGSLTLNGIVPLLFGRGSGVMSTGEFFDADIGGDILRRFTVFVDYGRGQVILDANASLAEAFGADVSGLSIRMGGNNRSAKIVDAVVEGSVAALAGIRAADEILRVNDASASDLSLDEVRAIFRIQGSRVEVVVGRNWDSVRIPIDLPRL